LFNNLRRGDIVEVKSAKEILDAIDKEGKSEALPFMPEMLKYCGRRYIVDKRADKICDTIKSSGSRRLPRTVLLEDLRCDGSAHDCCQLECRLFWKESWLRRVSSPDDPRSCEVEYIASASLAEFISNFTSSLQEVNGEKVKIFMCQATELYKASTQLRVFDPRPYLREFTNGNISLYKFIRGTVHAYNENIYLKFRDIITRRILKRLPAPRIHLAGTRTGPLIDNPLNLSTGDRVQVKTRDEIASTLNPHGRERGLWFDREMLPFCGGIYQVRQRVSRFISDRNCQMIELKTECVTLDGVVCSGEHSTYRHFCPRAIYPFWREVWLRRLIVKEPTQPVIGIYNVKSGAQ
jgi:hypothetical protein